MVMSMSNINCSSSSCVYMNDGKCSLNTVTKINYTDKKQLSNESEFENCDNSLCPYYSEQF